MMDAPKNFDDFVRIMHEAFEPDEMGFTPGQVVLQQEGPRPVVVGKVIMRQERFKQITWSCYPWFHTQDVLVNETGSHVLVLFWILASDVPELFEFMMNSIDREAKRLVDALLGITEAPPQDRSKFN